MISFRLSDDEYDHLVTLCLTQGARSLSDLARVAMQNLLNNGGSHSNASIEDKLNDLHGRMALLDRAVERLAQMVTSEAQSQAKGA